MTTPFRSSRDVILRTDALAEAVAFYTSVLGFRISSRAANLVGFETGSFCLYVEAGSEHGPVFDLLVADVAAAKSRLLAAGCALVEEDPALPRCYLRDPYGFTFNVGKASNE
jgi:catechol 2,3-dioxygenase-like lactoylglutathione lyase family enzyme